MSKKKLKVVFFLKLNSWRVPSPPCPPLPRLEKVSKSAKVLDVCTEEMKPSWLQCWNQRLRIYNLPSTLLPCPVSLWLSFLRTLPPSPTHAHISFSTIKHSQVVSMLRKKKKKKNLLLAMAGQRVPQWEQEEVPRGADGKEAFGVTQTKVQSQLHHCQLGESRHVRRTPAVLPTSMYESIDRKCLPTGGCGNTEEACQEIPFRRQPQPAEWRVENAPVSIHSLFQEAWGGVHEPLYSSHPLE